MTQGALAELGVTGDRDAVEVEVGQQRFRQTELVLL